MTYQEALDFKKSLKRDKITDKGMTMKIIVTPQAYNDLMKYVDDYRIYSFNDASALKYSSNNQFTVHGIWTNGADVVYRDLTKEKMDDNWES